MSNFLQQRWLLSRRHFLRGVGASVALPLLDAMTPLRARPPRPRRQAAAERVRLHPQRRQRHDLAGDEARAAATSSRPRCGPWRSIATTSPSSAACIIPTAWARPTSAPTPGSPGRRSMPKAPGSITTPSRATSSWPRSRRSTRASPRWSCRSARAPVSRTTRRTLAFSRDGVPLPAEDNPRNIFDRLFGEEPGASASATGASTSAGACWTPCSTRPSRCAANSARTIAPSSTNISTRSATWSSAPRGSTPGSTCPSRKWTARLPAQCLQGPGRRILPHDVRPDRARPAHRHDAAWSPT